MISGLDDRSGRPDADKSLRGMLSSRGSRVRFAFLSHLRPTRIEAMSLSTGSCSDATAGARKLRGFRGIWSADAAVPIAQCQADFIRRILLNEVNAGNRDLDLVRPLSTEIPLLAGENGSGIGVDE